MLIVIEGNIGSGKSTLCSQLLNYKFPFPHKILFEQVEEWEKNTHENKTILEYYYDSPSRWSFTFQIYVLLQRMNHIIEMTSKFPNTVFICERSHLTDLHIFAKRYYDLGHMNQIEWNTYLEAQKCISSRCPKIDGIIYNQCDIEICEKRIKERNRNGEQQLSSSYLKELNDRHSEWLKHETIPILTIDGNIEKNSEVRFQQLQSITDWILTL
jgi:deoxyadenosine/deoxycytidine kinase